MKKHQTPLALVILFITFVSVSCEKKESTAAAQEPVKLPMEVSYKGTAVMGGMKNVQIVMECNKRLGELNTDIADFLADTVTWHMADGTEVNASRDSVMVVIKNIIGSLSSLKIRYIAAVPVDNPDLKHEWVFSWTDETYNSKDGKVDHQFFHEDYRLENGKIREIYQYARPAPAEAAK